MLQTVRALSLPLALAAALSFSSVPTVAFAAAHHKGDAQINKAEKDLDLAKDKLAKSPKDFDGHKAKAVALIDQAKAELEAANAADAATPAPAPAAPAAK